MRRCPMRWLQRHMEARTQWVNLVTQIPTTLHLLWRCVARSLRVTWVAQPHNWRNPRSTPHHMALVPRKSLTSRRRDTPHLRLHDHCRSVSSRLTVSICFAPCITSVSNVNSLSQLSSTTIVCFCYAHMLSYLLVAVAIPTSSWILMSRHLHRLSLVVYAP